MGKFLNDIKIQQLNDTPTFINPDIDTKEISKVGTSGSELTDMVYNKAKKLVNEITELKRQNELADVQIQANKNLQDYELMWSTPDQDGNIRDKYSEENYTEYQAGLSEVYETNKKLIVNTKYANENDVNSWDHKIQESFNNAQFTEEGKKAEYDIKKITDETTIKIEALNSQKIANGDSDGSLTQQILNLYDGLEKVGIPKHKIEMMKIKSLVDTDISRMKLQIDEITNDSNLSIEQRMKKIEMIKKGFNSNLIYDNNAKQAVDSKLLKPEYAEMYKQYSMKTTKEAMLSANGFVIQAQQHIRDEKYRNDLAYTNSIMRIENDYRKDIIETKNAINSGNDNKIIQTLTDNPELTQDAIINSESESIKYYGQPSDKILNNDEYISVLSVNTINMDKSNMRTDNMNNIPRYESVVALQEKYSNYDDETKKHLNRQFVNDGVITLLENKVMNDDVVLPDTLSKEEIINYDNIGKRNKTSNKLYAFTGVDVRANKELSQKLSNMTYEQKEQLSDLIIGAGISGKFGFLLGNGKSIDQVSVLTAYKNNKDFKQYVDDNIQLINEVGQPKFKKAKINVGDVFEKVRDKRNKRIDKLDSRWKTKESGVNYKVEKRTIVIDQNTIPNLEEI